MGMLKKIRKEARRAVKEGWGLEESEVKCYVHYQPSYCKHRDVFLASDVTFDNVVLTCMVNCQIISMCISLMQTIMD